MYIFFAFKVVSYILTKSFCCCRYKGKLIKDTCHLNNYLKFIDYDCNDALYRRNAAQCTEALLHVFCLIHTHLER